MKKVLIIDDDATFQKTITETLKAISLDVISAFDGAEGLARALTEKPDLILLDIKMPKLGGLDFLKQLQEKSGGSQPIPVLITSNISSAENISEGVALGIKGYIVKSDESLDTIVGHVQALLAPKKNTGPVAS